ncbi:DUF3500 domain-containing protein [Phycicoccus sp. Soil803]|uniref:DUF3500 domain-containing protein n=1 Tax=Phycicoccus sp. Soil803 TaxID=1736415 RepID=UPI000710A4D7|nr:DUF3500 domain-containing protein [Phycicoccus sp. Soil803]KRF26579.1 hypothetical protein ASG95_02105 [Phycicoccus sp. Soil803]
MATTSPQLTSRMADAASRLVDSLGPEQREALAADLGDPAFREWSYLPGPRAGLVLGELTGTQRDAALALLDTGCSAGGAQTARAVIELDLIRRQLGGGDPRPGDDRFWFRVFGDPSTGVWAWRVNGHHLAVHVTVAGGELTVTPSFFGSEPARVPTGPHQGLRVLTAEEDLARELLASLDEPQRREAITSATAPADVLTRHDPVADPTRIGAGISHGDLTPAQQDRLHRLVRHYFDRTPEDAAAAAWAAADRAGLDAIRFAWAGGTSPGQGHYYSALGPTFLLEYDNTQDGANHIHSVWRDLTDDWGGDLLARHYASGHH